jgi:hypothetical protein
MESGQRNKKTTDNSSLQQLQGSGFHRIFSEKSKSSFIFEIISKKSSQPRQALER